MLWEDIRELYPNSFVKLKILDSNTVGPKEYITDVDLIRILNGNKEVLQELRNCKKGELVYSTYHKSVEIETHLHFGFRRRIVDE